MWVSKLHIWVEKKNLIFFVNSNLKTWLEVSIKNVAALNDVKIIY